MYLLPKIDKRLENAPGRPVILNYATPTEKVSEFVDHHLQPIIKSGASYTKDTESFLSKLKGIVMQNEKALINDHLRVPKVSSKLHIPTIDNFTLMYP